MGRSKENLNLLFSETESVNNTRRIEIPWLPVVIFTALIGFIIGSGRKLGVQGLKDALLEEPTAPPITDCLRTAKAHPELGTPKGIEIIDGRRTCVYSGQK